MELAALILSIANSFFFIWHLVILHQSGTNAFGRTAKQQEEWECRIRQSQERVMDKLEKRN